MQNEQTYHEPALLTEALEGLAIRPGGAYIDCTLGDAGHSAAILAASSPDGRLLGIDADPEALAASRHVLRFYGTRAHLIQSNFASIAEVARAEGFIPVDGVLFDLGLSARQLEVEDRGFSFQRAAPLDMRFTPSEGPTAADLVGSLSEVELTNLIGRLGEEPRARRIARAIIAARPIGDAAHLAEVVRRASGYRRGRTHPATRTFQALRIAVNAELERLEQGLEAALAVLRVGGRLVSIAYHSLEDRILKNFIRTTDGLDALNKKVIRPSAAEVARNRRSRSARLRVATKTA